MISNYDISDNKSSSKVLRPPGGGSSDIFGSDMPQTPRNVKNRMVSNIFSVEKDNSVKNTVRQGAHRFYFIGDNPRRGQKTVDSHNRLFGEPMRPITPGKNHMKSSIPFGQNTETAAAQKLLTNGSSTTNGATTNGHYNGKSGSVSSASSSVSSSTENLKMNSGSRSVFIRNMSRAEDIGESKLIKSDTECPLTPVASNTRVAAPAKILGIDQPCLDLEVGDVPKDNEIFTESGKHDVRMQSRQDSASNVEQPHSLDKMHSEPDLKEPLSLCPDTVKEVHDPCNSRNPITGLGLNGDGVGGLKPVKQKIREGNPVTGEGYRPGGTDFIQAAGSTNGGSVGNGGNSGNGGNNGNGGNSVVNKNRVPPGGYSSGLW
ncbi:microtubule-associated protein Jupiter isoform X2 [Drosophila obscura]|uniref:microtubule-associated protein Jupiter isoform X2 n=1 Tax=Drosophila obscura TaxID=7282 RepID=UPI000B9F9D1E|nr:microtubule-associated protein Jupiter isoform X2 [Drosophila obscura]